MKVKIIAMHKNEVLLLKTWAIYHSNEFGVENIYIIDNGSTKEDVLTTLKELEKLGINVIYDYPDREHFVRKGEVVKEVIEKIDSEDPGDFYIPLDCDEFLCIYDKSKKDFLFGFDNISHYLRKFIGSDETLMIGFGADNCPWDQQSFIVKGRRKCFFTRDNCLELDVGFHKGRSKRSPFNVTTPLCYLHMHNKPIKKLVEDAKQKMIGRVDSFEKGDLLKYKEEKRTGWHLVEELLIETEADYRSFIQQKYRSVNLIEIIGFIDSLHINGLEYPYPNFIDSFKY